MLLTTSATTSVTIVTVPAPARACVIASAAYGSELAPQVQFLREFRDGTVMSTFAGAHFMNVFNTFYYSFSTKVAQVTAASPILQAATRVMIYPLIGALHVAAAIYQLCPQGSALAIIVTGVVASSLIGIVYVSPVAIALGMIRRKVRDSGGN